MDAQKTPAGPSFAESHYEEVFHIFAAIAALFGYPPPPPPGKLRARPEWSEFIAKRGTEIKIPDIEFYGNSPYEKKMVRDEAHHALHLLDERIRECKRNKDKLGMNGLKYIQGTIKVFLGMVEGGLPEDAGWLGAIPVVGPMVRKRRQQKRAYEEALKKAESMTRGRPVKEKPRFFDTKNDMQLRVIYNTIRQYIVDENLTAEGSDVKALGKQTFTQYKMVKESGGSTTEAINFNKWLGVFFSDLFKAM